MLQYGYISGTAAGSSVAITLPTAYTTTKYSTVASPYTTTNSWADAATNTKSTTGFKILNITNTGTKPPYHWFTIGY